MLKRIMLITFSAMLVILLAACSGGNAPENADASTVVGILKIENVNTSANTFDLVDTKSGEAINYDILIVEDKEVVDSQCMGVMGTPSVLFATEDGQIERDGNTVTANGGKAYTTAAELEYTLEDGTLTIIG